MDRRNHCPGEGRSIIATRYGTDWRSVLKAPWRGIARWWLLKIYATVDWASSSERHGQGITEAYNTAGVTVATDAQRKQLASDIEGMRSSGVIVMPDGYRLNLITDGANTFGTFVAQTATANTAIVIAIVGTNLTTEVSGGSFAAGKVHANVDSQKMRGLLSWISTVPTTSSGASGRRTTKAKGNPPLTRSGTRSHPMIRPRWRPCSRQRRLRCRPM